ncbi:MULTISPECIES: hypothetical protein [unclassified Ectothiorhodospira]|uniref:hypothetical protein n=1 Tax=unclassified Ectothiorhodospira TaxID=2684909 RepID=UPI001EE95A4F|nr:MULTISPECIES: hypothetical protein [unclassified Ectothiorhodospira]MCG5516258.1 hypothetical protein [Ectothiorhodospira sp. 9100]MCG5518069.1 hypothetical protein [Ectothiorhodospira sp. 9905]
MIGLLLFPILVCGYLYITAWPSERIRISLYHGWSLYIRAAAYGMMIVAAIFFLFGIALPKLGLLVGNMTGFTPFPNTNIFLFISQLIEESNVLHLEKSEKTKVSLDIASISITSISISWLLATFINKISSGNSNISKAISRAIRVDALTFSSIERLYAAKSPIEYQLLMIAKQADSDIAYNEDIGKLRGKVYQAILDGKIDRKDRNKMKEIFKVLQYRELNYSLITLENDKFYIGLPKILPEPDEESITSSSVQIIPVMSGYRDEKKLPVFTTKYDFDLGSTSSQDCISFPRDKIVTVSGFSFETHNRIKQISLQSESVKNSR